MASPSSTSALLAGWSNSTPPAGPLGGTSGTPDAAASTPSSASVKLALDEDGTPSQPATLPSVPRNDPTLAPAQPSAAERTRAALPSTAVAGASAPWVYGV